LCYLCQRYNLKANHNFSVEQRVTDLVVLSMSKIQSESKSQLLWLTCRYTKCCVIYVKDTIWKQITTEPVPLSSVVRLCYLCQRYNLKANHNRKILLDRHAAVVLSMSKIQSESKSQHEAGFQFQHRGCVIYVKDTIWKQITTAAFRAQYRAELCYLCQRYNLKANHNFIALRSHSVRVVLSMSKIQSESKSQHKSPISPCFLSCVIYVKDTIWKQITTGSSSPL